MRLRFPLLLVASLLLARPTQGQPPPDGRTIALSHPESVAAGAEGTVFYAADVGATTETTAKDGDGYVARLAADGTVETRRYLPAAPDTLHAPKGTVVTNGRLYTADIDRIVGFDLSDRTQIAEVSLKDKGVSFLNDVAVLDAQTLFVSASSQGRIYRVNLRNGTATALDVEVLGANGLAVAQDTLRAVTFGGEAGGQLWTIALTSQGEVRSAEAQTIIEGGRFDGLVLHDGHALVTDWGVEGASDSPPALHRIALPDAETVQTTRYPDWRGPADFTCRRDRCWIPDLPAGAVRVVAPNRRP